MTHVPETVVRLLAAACVGALASACVIFPVPAVLAPKVSGVVLENGVPVEGAQIILAAASLSSADDLATSGGSPRATTKTDAEGRFEIGPLRGVKVLHAFGDEIHFASLVIKDRGRSFVGFADSGIGVASGPIDGTCDLARPTEVPPSLVSAPPAIFCDHLRLKKLN